MQSPQELVAELVLLLAVILVAAKIGAEVTERFLKVPPVLGELAAGIAIGPFALGGLRIGGFGPLFEIPVVSQVVDGALHTSDSTVPVAPEFFFVAQVAAVLLLFQAGLETNRRQFFRYAKPATAVAIGGIILPFVLGVTATLMFGFASLDSIGGLLPALFVGAAMTATSVGITARVLADIRGMDTPEGVTILGAAVVDDVLGVLILTVIIGIEEPSEVSVGSILLITAKAVGFWLGLTLLGTVFANHISRAVLWLRTSGAMLGIAFAIAFLAAGLAERFGLAMIIGSYSIGLALSSTELKRRLEVPMHNVNQFVVPIFFVVIGMLVDLPAILQGALLFGVVLSLFAIASKVVGAGAPALAVGFNNRGAWRIAIGMLPRGEVALIVAGIGLASGVIEQDVFGVAVMMTVVTTGIAPLLLVPAFRLRGSGLRHGSSVEEPEHAPEEAAPETGDRTAQPAAEDD